MKKRVLITGGCGFIGTNSSLAFDDEGFHVLAVDNFSRPTGRHNAQELESRGSIEIQEFDISNKDNIDRILKSFQPNVVLHLAAQVAVTTSLENPYLDFNSNIVASFNLLESMRTHSNARLIFSSTNKVYGNLEELPIKVEASRYWYAKEEFKGVSEQQVFDPHSPYGCSKGAVDKYITDYNRSYGLDSVVLRQSCIYGKRQYGIEDQGWIAWFMISALRNRAVTIYGDGKQVRDALYVEDLCDLYLKLTTQEKMSKRVFNVGGGVDNSISVLELLIWIQSNFAPELSWDYSEERLGDQKIFVSDNTSLENELGWKPKTPLSLGLTSVWSWLEKRIKDEI